LGRGWESFRDLEDRLKRLEEESYLEFKNSGTFITGKLQEEEGEEEVAVLGDMLASDLGGAGQRASSGEYRQSEANAVEEAQDPLVGAYSRTHETHAVKGAVGDVLVEEETSWEHAAALVGDDDLRRIYAAALGYAALVRPLL
jgi:hypothetical protein